VRGVWSTLDNLGLVAIPFSNKKGAAAHFKKGNDALTQLNSALIKF
jgi:hypothetical protein